MARKNRRDLFNPSVVSINHCIARCVRQLFLLDNEEFKRIRLAWITEHLEFLCANYGMDLLVMAFLSNHCHLILRNRPDAILELSEEEIARRWLRLFPGNSRKKRKFKKDAEGKDTDIPERYEPTEKAIKALVNNHKKLEKVRVQLSDISWFMRSFCQYVAVKANLDDGTAGHFWQGRFFSQALIDEEALLACSIYVDLNPIRAGIADDIDQCYHTSIFARIQSARIARELEKQAKKASKGKGDEKRKRTRRPDDFLAPLQLKEQHHKGAQLNQSGFRLSDRGFLRFSLEQYVELLRYTVAMMREDRSQGASRSIPAMLESMKISPESWKKIFTPTSNLFRRSQEVRLQETTPAK